MEKIYIYDQRVINSKLKELIWLPLTGIRWSYGTLFLEIGKELYEEEYTKNRKTPRCIHNFMIDPNRRFQNSKKLIFSCDSVDRRVYHKVMKKLFGLKIVDIGMFNISWICELYIELEWNIKFHSFNTTNHNPYGWRTGFLDSISYKDQKNINRKESKYQIWCQWWQYKSEWSKIWKLCLIQNNII